MDSSLQTDDSTSSKSLQKLVTQKSFTGSIKTRKSLGALSENSSKKNMHSTPKFSKSQKTTSLEDHFSLRKRKLLGQGSLVLKKSKSIQTESKCDCEIFNENGIEMFCSDKQDKHYYQNLSEKVAADSSSIVEKNLKLQETLKEKEDLLSKANSCVDELLEIIKTGQELADYVEECDKITPIIDRDDSGLGSSINSTTDMIPIENESAVYLKDSEISVASSSLAGSLVDEEEDITPKKVLKVEANVQKTSKNEMIESNTKNKYVQASVCCVCDFTDEEQLKLMENPAEDELFYQFEVNKHRTTIDVTQSENEFLKFEISEKEKELLEKESIQEKLKVQASSAEELIKLVKENILTRPIE